ncbi:MAG: acetyl-CoA hydrolase/transferase C-terminal domain-containing protein [Tissierellia bacterium]|nr:acetyl-CoA hydrolase/transferase C-terminal domain-containing protein [Tissierellia bacterium]
MKDYKDKLITVEEALKLVKSDSQVVNGLGGSESVAFFGQLHTIADQVKNVNVTTYLAQYLQPYMDEKYKDSFHVDSEFYTGVNRKVEAMGMGSYIPNNLSAAAVERLTHIKPNIFVFTTSLPDKHGNVSLSLGNVYEGKMIEAADIVIAEVSPNFPRTFGNYNYTVDDIDYFIEVDTVPPMVPDSQPSEKDNVIGKLIADMIPDGSCVQIGIGGIPDAVASFLLEKKDLGIHTELFTPGLAKLVLNGSVNGSKKQIDKNKVITAFALGNQELYDLLDDNPMIEIRDGGYCNSPYVIAQNDNQVSINTAIEIDLSGQVCSESIGTRQFSGAGGQADTHRGAYMSKGGKAIIALYSTAMIKDKKTGERVEKSKIVPTLAPGAFVTLQRQDLDMVVTEYGVAKLKGKNMKERVQALIDVAHPKFREELKQNAIELGLI